MAVRSKQLLPLSCIHYFSLLIEVCKPKENRALKRQRPGVKPGSICALTSVDTGKMRLERGKSQNCAQQRLSLPMSNFWGNPFFRLKNCTCIFFFSPLHLTNKRCTSPLHTHTLSYAKAVSCDFYFFRTARIMKVLCLKKKKKVGRILGESYASKEEEPHQESANH